MKHTAKLITIITALIAAVSIYKIKNVDEINRITPDLIKFAKWIKEHKKTYKTPNEYIYRFKLFQQTLRKIEAHRQDDTALHTLGLNEFSDFSNKEFLAKYTGFKISKEKRNFKYISALPQGPNSYFDWRPRGVVSKIRSQGRCGSCWAFSAIASVEAAYAISRKQLISFSEQQLIDCTPSYGNHGCNGGSINYSFNYIKDKGSQYRATYKYTGKQGTCKYNPAKTVIKNRGLYNVPKNNDLQLGYAVSKTVVSIAIDSSGIMNYRSGIFNGKCGTALNHCMNIVGFGAQQGIRYWIVRNSWGASWGEQGYIRMIRQSGAGKCGINLAASYPVV